MTVHRRILGRTLEGSKGQDSPILDSLTLVDAGQAQVQVYFTPGVTADQIDKAKLPGLADFRTIGGALVVSFPEFGPEFGKSSVDIPLVNQSPITITPTLPETEIFADQNAALVERNGETVQTVCDWLTWHAREHGLQAALIVDRGKPGQSDRFAKSLANKLGKNDLQHLTIVVLSSTMPLGKPGLGPESHPFNAPDAPGKDRMSAPKPDPWSAPLGAPSLYELLRWRFLNTARAVMNIDMHDLIAAPLGSGKSVFDQAVNAPHGVVTLTGARAYPWSLRKGKPARFGDHICVQFDSTQTHSRWCIAPGIAPGIAPDDVTWRMVRLTGATPDEMPVTFHRCMALRHRSGGKDAGKISKIVPKSSLVETPELLAQAAALGDKPVRMPRENDENTDNSRVAIVTCMKNEGPFILEWLAYHRVIGVDDFLVYSNDCDDGTDTMLELLQAKGFLQHRENPFRKSGLKPQHAALAASEREPLVKNAGWLICMDVDEFINIHVGDGTLAALFAALPDANMISMTWRLFGNADVTDFKDELITARYTSCAPHMTRKPHQAWGFKTLYRNIGLFKKMGVHRPKGLKSQLVDQISWVNGSGALMPKKEYRNAWRSTTKTIGYDLVTLNHYSLRSAESFLVKRDRGRVNHVDRDQGLAYWFRMNNNAESDQSIQRMLPLLRAEMNQILSDPDIAAAHAQSVKRHRARIDDLKQTEHYSTFFADLTSPRLRRLSRQHQHFGSAVFLHGPDCIPQDFPEGELPADFLFTVPK